VNDKQAEPQKISLVQAKDMVSLLCPECRKMAIKLGRDPCLYSKAVAGVSVEHKRLWLVCAKHGIEFASLGLNEESVELLKDAME